MSEVEETPKAGKVFELEEVKKHTREDDCWLVVDGDVYDVTEFLDEHPGGFDIIISNTGKDATEDFDEIGHSKSARELLSNYKIGAYAAKIWKIKTKQEKILQQLESEPESRLTRKFKH